MSHLVSNYERVDADANLYVQITKGDVKRAVPKDHCKCAVAQAIKRAVGHDDAAAVIFPSVAYVLMPTAAQTARKSKQRVREGDLAWHRFRLSPALGAQILNFDLTGDFPEHGYVFQAPSPSQRMDHKVKVRTDPPVPGTRGMINSRAPWRRDRHFRLVEEEPAVEEA